MKAGPELPDLPSGAKKLLRALAQPGPYPVLRGDLGLIGIPGVVLAPTSGLGLPAVAFGHDWLQSPDRYLPLLRHLASWGFVTAAPASQRGPVPSHARFSADLRTALDVCVGVRLGDGAISVDRRRLALVGHGMGGGCAVLAAADHEVAAVVTLAAAQTRPSAEDVARTLSTPSLHLAAGKDQVAPVNAGALPLAEAWGGPVLLRTLPKADHLGFLSGKALIDGLLAGRPNGKTLKLTKALLTGFLLYEVLGERSVEELVNGEVKGTELTLQRPAPATR
jgi:dienelactone hydrolase